MERLPFEDEISVGDVRRDWDNILPALQRIKVEQEASWRTEDIYALCIQERAFLYLFEGGFAIVGRVQDPYTLEIELHLYAVSSTRKTSCVGLMPFLNGLAKQVGATSITMETNHRMETMKTYGWQPVHTKYKRSV